MYYINSRTRTRSFSSLTCGLNEDELGLDPVVLLLLNEDFPSLDCLPLFFEAPLPLPPP